MPVISAVFGCNTFSLYKSHKQESVRLTKVGILQYGIQSEKEYSQTGD